MESSLRRGIGGLVVSALILLSPGEPAYAQAARIAAGDSAATTPVRVGPPAAAVLSIPSSLAPALGAGFAAPSAPLPPAAPGTPAPDAAAPVPLANPAAASPAAEEKTAPVAVPEQALSPAPGATTTLADVAATPAAPSDKPQDQAANGESAGRLFDGSVAPVSAIVPAVPSGALATPAPTPRLAGLARARAAVAAPFRRIGALAETLKRMSSGEPSIQEFTLPYKRRVFGARIMRMLDAPIALGLGWGMGRLIDLANAGHQVPGAMVPFIAVAAFLVATTVGELVKDLKYMLIVNFTQFDVIEAFRTDVFKKIFASSRTTFSKEDPGAVASRLADDANEVVNIGIFTPISTPSHLLGIVASTAMLVWTNVSAALSSAGHSPLALPLWLGVVGILGAVMAAHGLISSRSASKFETLEEEYQSLRSGLVSHAARALTDRAVYLGLGIDEQPISLFRQKAHALSELGKVQTRLEQRYHFQQRVMGILSTDLLITLAASTMLFLAGFPSVGMITAMTAYAVGISEGVAGVAEDYTTFRKGAGATVAIRKLRAAVPDVDAPDAVDLGPLHGRIEFRHVSFAFEEGGREILKDLSFTIEPGESVAFVGPSGAGKSTILNLITRLYRPTAGSILIDGKDLAAIKINSFRHQLALVPQESGLMNASVKDNLMMVKPSATVEELELALKAAGAYDFLLEKSNAAPKTTAAGLELNVDEFSGGQQQRIAIARALLRNSNLLLLDEWSSALDQETERSINHTLEKMNKGRTVVVVDHNLRFDKRRTRIIVLENGRIVASGKHGTLIKESPLYAKLVSIAKENAADPK